MELPKVLKRKSNLLIIFIFIGIISSHQYLLKKIGDFLIYEQSPRKADLIVVLNGRDTERSLAAVDLYKEGYANLIIMARGGRQPGSDEFWKRVGGKFNEKAFFQKAIEAMGIPGHAFELIGDGVTSTYDEAMATSAFMKKNGYKSILLVTSKWHSRRAYLTFRSVLGKKSEIRITVVPSRYDSFNPRKWWTKKSDTELICYEYVRMIYYTVTLRINPVEILN